MELFITKFVDDFLVSGRQSDINHFMECLVKTFTLGEVNYGNNLSFEGCKITRFDDGSVELFMPDYFSRVKTLKFSKTRRRQTATKADEHEISSYRSLAETLPFLGQAVLPQACLVASKM